MNNMNERNFHIEAMPPEKKYVEKAKELEAEVTKDTDLKKRIEELTIEHDRLMDEWDKATLAGQDKVADQLLQDAGAILNELARINPQTKGEKELAEKSKTDINSMADFKKEAEDLTKNQFKN